MVQTELAYEIEDSLPAKSRYYKSSTPLVAVVKYIQHLKRTNSQTVIHQQSDITDCGFCVRSDPYFLYFIAKMCVKTGLYIDLAIQSLYEYMQHLTYYRHFDPNY
jgi:hypothetical protein